MEKSTAKWAWGGREDGCHRQDLKSRNRRLRERADIGALETRGQAQFTGFKVLSVAALPVAAAAPPRPSESRAWGEALKKTYSAATLELISGRAAQAMQEQGAVADRTAVCMDALGRIVF